ncbi:hypothetical protein [Sphingopyxis sp. GW247-27LB]|uniref:hypothetical protein n=1 Tax=Sphingopyxis sp. GW247-27LB TaxID=2012632 RepID=UPI000BA6BBE5|nr:hypothetical protein [Sphingopyxis sp. GW247-27LB]PAL23582.1 hypothetical protein CD928_05810 [Sphingopyxis sp. GW247-27LB]
MFTDRFSGYSGETIECERGGIRFVATLHADDDMTPPWEREDGHGPVSDWRARNYAGRYDKAPGDLKLCDDGGSVYHGRARFYDFAEACKIARRDGWGYIPDPMTALQNSGGKWYAWFGNGHAPGCNVGGFDSESKAVAALHDAHRATMTPRQYAAAAAMADYDRLRKWCDDQWQYAGVAVQAFVEDLPLTGEFDHALWGIESDAGDYLTETANDYLDECDAAARAAAVAMGTRLAALVSA